MDEKEEKLKKIDIENIIWTIYIGIVILSFISNLYEIDYIKNDNNNSRKKYREINIIIFSITFIIYMYFVIDNYQDVTKLNTNSSKKKEEYTKLSFLASLLVAIAGAIFLYIAIFDTKIETEIAFN